MKWLVTCEHYTNHIPVAYLPLFGKAAAVVDSHRGYDVGAASLYHRLETLFDRSFHCPYSRLLIEPNRSLHHRHLFSPFSMQLDKKERTRLIAQLYQPYRKQIEDYIRQQGNEPLIHVGVHTFTPKLGNQARNAELGLLFDPKQPREKEIARLWKRELVALENIRVRFNYPYRGSADGLTTYLRKCFPFHYVGLELEVRNNDVKRLESVIRESLVRLKDALS